MRSAPEQGGFTLIEILVALILMTIGLLGVLSMHMTSARANRAAMRLDRAVAISEDTMETYRGVPPTALTAGTTTLSDFTTADGTIYHRRVIIAPAASTASLIVITVETTFGDEGDESDLHTARMQMMRTAVERF